MDVKSQIQQDRDEQVDMSEGADRKRGGFLSQLRFIALLLALVLIVRSFVFAPFSIPSESMLPRLWNGDYLLAAKWPYGFSNNSLPFDTNLFPNRVLANPPELGDVVIFKHPIERIDYIKRVVALPGDTIAMRDGQIILNGKVISRELIADFMIPVSVNTDCGRGGLLLTETGARDVCVYRQFRETLPNGRSYEVLDLGTTGNDNIDPVTIPEGHMFVMGDNRDNSQDSRFPAQAGGGVGVVPQANLVGRAQIIMWSTDGSAQWVKPWTWFTAARWDRIGNGL